MAESVDRTTYFNNATHFRCQVDVPKTPRPEVANYPASRLYSKEGFPTDYIVVYSPHRRNEMMEVFSQ